MLAPAKPVLQHEIVSATHQISFDPLNPIDKHEATVTLFNLQITEA